jgi:hypothetical protein
VLADGRRGVLRREVAAFLAAEGLPVIRAGRPGGSNPGLTVLAAAAVGTWVAARGGQPLDRWAVPRDRGPGPSGPP